MCNDKSQKLKTTEWQTWMIKSSKQKWKKKQLDKFGLVSLSDGISAFVPKPSL